MAFFRSMIFEKNQKMAGTKYFFVSKNQLCHVCQPCERIFEICFVFSHFFVRASNGRQYSNFRNKCPKLGTRTPEDMILINLCDSVASDPSGFVLVAALRTCKKMALNDVRY